MSSGILAPTSSSINSSVKQQHAGETLPRSLAACHPAPRRVGYKAADMATTAAPRSKRVGWMPLVLGQPLLPALKQRTCTSYQSITILICLLRFFLLCFLTNLQWLAYHPCPSGKWGPFAIGWWIMAGPPAFGSSPSMDGMCLWFHTGGSMVPLLVQHTRLFLASSTAHLLDTLWQHDCQPPQLMCHPDTHSSKAAD
jgi:hypothetical protein